MKIHEKRQVVLYVPIAIWLISPWILMFHKRYFPIMYLKWLFEFLMPPIVFHPRLKKSWVISLFKAIVPQKNILVVGPVPGQKYSEITFPILSPNLATERDVHFLKNPIYVGGNRGRGQI
ncbi:hypothetical protein Ahy_B06g082973 isoform A [Arachis hypogaea]|uniref:Cytochrome f large domain-containing protein n=1 Tax=Arachis hypogaea TaxID=3818 RepID=A0A444YP33_ARAHY|nr:hypothetical protein Ahy_B06g082973 isoform A [Arachis hypogaea]